MIKRDFLEYIYRTVASIDYYYYVDTAGVVQTTTTKTPLSFAPKGWREQGLKWSRGFTYHGVLQSFTEPLKFVEDGAAILRYLQATYGTEPGAMLLIEKFNRTLAVQAYETYYLGELDFSRYNSEKDFANAEVSEGGFLAKLKAKESTDMEIPVTANINRLWVNMDGLRVLALFEFTGIDQPVDQSPPTFVKSDRENFPTFLYYKTEGYSNGDNNPKGNDYLGPFSKMFSQNYYNADMISLGSADKWIVRNVSATASYTYNLKGSITIEHSNSVAGTRRMYVYAYKNNVAANGTLVTKYQMAAGGAIAGFGSLTETVEFDYDIVVAPNEAVWVWFRHTGTPGDVSYHLSGCELVVEVPNMVKQSYVTALRPYVVGQALLASVNAGTTFDSYVLGTTHSNKVLTCGDALRGLLQATMKTNVADYYQSVNALFNTCMLYDRTTDTATIDYKAAAFDNSIEILDLGEVANFKYYPLTEEMFAKIIFGYQNTEYDGVNGKDEFNIGLTFQSALTRVVNEKNLRSVYRADMNGIELTRGNDTDKLLADASSDNDVFWLHIEDTPAGTIPVGLPGAGEDYYNLQRSGYTVTQGLNSPDTAFNLYLSPKTCAINHGDYINSVLYPQITLPTGSLTFQVGDKNQDDDISLIWTPSSIIDERADITLTDLADPLFYPIVLELDCKIPQNILAAISATPCGKIKATVQGVPVYGFIYEVTDEPVMEPKQTYKLLCSTSTNLADLIAVL